MSFWRDMRELFIWVVAPVLVALTLWKYIG